MTDRGAPGRRFASRVGIVCLLAAFAGFGLAETASAQSKQLLWGDTHLHTSNSFDAYLNRNMTIDPATAYRFAQGLPVIHPYHGARVQLRTPLDFLVVADHAEYLGVMRHIIERGIPTEDLGLIDRLKAIYIEYWLNDVVDSNRGREAFASLLPDDSVSVEEAAARRPQVAIPAAATMQTTIWNETIRTADEYDRPGQFTTLIGWEWSSVPSGANLHRVVVTSAPADVAGRFFPWSSVDSAYPEDLWAWLDRTSEETGAEFVAIPHNSNISKGYMFSDRTLRGAAYSPELAKSRMRWEPIVEVTQIKGDSETHPDFSPDDPFADFELYPHYIQPHPPAYDPQPGDYVRPALRRGLALERELGTNPFQFGMIGSTDSHSGLASAEEPNFFGKFARDSTPETKESVTRQTSSGTSPNGWSMSASGLAAVWATANTREAILDAFRRRETYATTGTRIAVRVTGRIGDAEVPMGGALSTEGALPIELEIEALKDPVGANLDRIQVVKGWIDGSGETHEKIYDVAASDDRVPDSGGVLPPVGNTVDPSTGRYRNDIGAAQLAASWVDPDFDPTQASFYYVRVIEIPTPRHSLADALALGRDPTDIRGGWFLQERAYTSPIWVTP